MKESWQGGIEDLSQAKNWQAQHIVLYERLSIIEVVFFPMADCNLSSGATISVCARGKAL